MNLDAELLDLLGRAAQAVKSKKLDVAEVLYREASKMGHGPAMSWIAASYHKRGQLPEAEEWYKRAVEQGDSTAIVNLASLYEQLGQSDDAARLYAKAASDDDPVLVAHHARFLGSIGESEQAIAAYRKAIAGFDRPSARAHFELANILVSTGRRLEALSEFKAAMAVGAGEFTDKAMIAIEQMNGQECTDILSTQSSRLELAFRLFNEHHFDDARQLFQEIIDSGVDSVADVARLGLGELDITEGDPGSAELLYREVIGGRRSDLYGYAWLGIATCLVLIEKEDERDEDALIAYARAVECGPEEISERARTAAKAIRDAAGD